MKRLVLLGAAMLVAACGGSGGAAVVKPKPTPIPPVLSSATAGDLGQILVDAQGHSLYFFVPEQGSKIVCTGDCTTTWLPLLAVGSSAPTSAVPLPGVVDALERPEGMRQVTYDGWPLYRYAMDKQPGDVLGNRSGGQWFVALAAGETTPTPTPPPPPPAAPPAQAPPPPAPPPMRPTPVPFGNDGDADNRGGPSDGDGNK